MSTLFVRMVGVGHQVGLILRKLLCKRDRCHLLNAFFLLKRNSFVKYFDSGQQVVPAGSINFATNEFPYWRCLRQNNTCIDIGRVCFAPGDVRLINQ